MREFRPPARKRGARLGLTVALTLLLLLTPLIFVAPMSFATLRIVYTVGPEVLRIETGVPVDGAKSVPIASIRERRVVALHGARRTAGTALGGFCAGRFWFQEIGDAWIATDCGGRGVLLRSDAMDRAIVVSPPDPEAFLRDLDGRTGAVIRLAPPEDAFLRPLLTVVAIVILVVAASVIALAVRGPEAMRYLVGGGMLEVRTLFGRQRWMVAGARAKAQRAKITVKIAGAGMPGYVTGLFREGGETTRVYATDPVEGVLFEGPARVYLSPDDRDGFLRALADEGAKVEGIEG
jgi:hypothetical protein